MIMKLSDIKNGNLSAEWAEKGLLHRMQQPLFLLSFAQRPKVSTPLR